MLLVREEDGVRSQSLSWVSEKLAILREMLFLWYYTLGRRTNEYLWP